MEKNKKNEGWIVGVCQLCKKEIKNTEEWETTEGYGLIHKRCNNEHS